MAGVEEAVEHAGDRGSVAQNLAPVLNGRFEVKSVLVRS